MIVAGISHPVRLRFAEANARQKGPKSAALRSPYNGIPPVGICGTRSAFEGALLVIVSVVVVAAPLGVTEGGVNEQCASEGSPEQAKSTV